MTNTPQTQVDIVPDVRRRQRRGRRPRTLPGKAWRVLRRRVKWRIIFIVLLIVVIVGAGSQIVLISDAVRALDRSYQSVERVIRSFSDKPGTDLTLTDFERLQSALRDMGEDLARVSNRVQLVGPLTAANPEWAIQSQGLAVAQALVGAADDMLAGFEPTLFYLVSGETEAPVVTQISSGERVVDLLEIGQGRFVRAAEALARARSGLDAIDLEGVSPTLLLQINELEAYYGQLIEMNRLLLDAPDILTLALGLDETQNYLILAQNSDELRPSGGYISTYGWLTVRNGRIVDYDYLPTTTRTPSPPPAAFAETFDVPPWWIQYQQPIYAAWDGSWYADFAQTADLARRYYDAGENPNAPLDGVIAIDIRGFEYLLEALNVVRVPGYDTAVTAENFREVVYDIRATGEGDTPHKQFVAAVYEAIFTGWQTLNRDADINAALLGALLQSLLEKHIMIYSVYPEINNMVDSLGWSGRQEPGTDHDYLMVVDANLGNKSNRSIIRQITYDVMIQPAGNLDSRVTVSYDYPAVIADQDPAVNPLYHGMLDYNNLLQIFVPQASSLQATDEFPGAVDTVEAEEHAAFVAQVQVAYDSVARFQVDYETPALVDSVGPYQRYRLLVQKQPGTLADTLSVQVQLPAGAQVIKVTPAPVTTFSLETLILEFRENLASDQWIEIIYQPAGADN
jgi:hypothetical protein